MKVTVLALTSCCGAVAADGSAGTGYAALDRAYRSLVAKDYDAAIESFRSVVALSPARADVRKDLAYTYLKIGEPVLAREQFRTAMELDPADTHVALEFGFLCYETGEPVLARRTFDRLRHTGNRTAQEAFENIDRPLREGLERWQGAVQLAPENFSNHEELAKIAERRDELTLAAKHYETAWKLRPDLRQLLLDLGRVWKLQGRDSAAMAALLAASRSPESRTAERGRELLPSRYPYVYEFRDAIALDSANVELRRELAYLLLAMQQRNQAEEEFSRLCELAPKDLLSAAQLGFLRLDRGDQTRALPLLDRVLKEGDDELADRVREALRLPKTLRRRAETPRASVSNEAKILAERSLEKGYLKDALKYLQVAHENDPIDFSIMLKLGWTNNLLHDDAEAVRWFRLATKSPDEQVASEAKRAWSNLAPALTPWRTTTWLFPNYSSRWKNAFAYGQAKTEIKIAKLPVTPYLSIRFIGDVRGRTETSAVLGPQYMSEGSFIVAAGASSMWHGITAWAEAGGAIRYRDQSNAGRVLPDYRGGVAWARAWNHNALLFETNMDGVFVSRFGNDTLAYLQTRTGYKLHHNAQAYWNFNTTSDAKRQAWANFVEQGPGVRLRISALVFTVNMLQGLYTIREGNPYPPVFRDVRAGVWYAFTR